MALPKAWVVFPCQQGLSPSYRTTGIFAGKLNNNTFHLAAPGSHSAVCLAQRAPFQPPELGWLGCLLLEAGAQVLTQADSNPM